ncbi:UPF0161 protein At3g09310 isoform X2 [Magnolia sinica]|uniref:UPF0161 protein At3g09310 isoform X2 n=1 Tax=Magnolia sinica TaxID=86752 RepID=UPI00265AA174|nr:UPF0161 protein At3g09310 isoform X2 [Magnolia sinica]
MALVAFLPSYKSLSFPRIQNPRLHNPHQKQEISSLHLKTKLHRIRSSATGGPEKDTNQKKTVQDEEVDLGVRAALSMLKFYKREISPLLPSSCRYVPTCSEYSMQAYKKYGVAKGTILTAWRLCRCNPLGGSGFDPPRWFDEKRPPEE